MDITQLILDDHHEQRRLFAILEQIDRADTATLTAIWERLAAFLEMHAEAEEELFYPALLQVGKRPGGRQRGGRDTRRDPRPQRDPRRDHRGRGQQVGTDGWYDGRRGREPGQQRPHGRGGTRGPHRLPPPRRLRYATTWRRVRRLRGGAHHRRPAESTWIRRPTSRAPAASGQVEDRCVIDRGAPAGVTGRPPRRRERPGRRSPPRS